MEGMARSAVAASGIQAVDATRRTRLDAGRPMKTCTTIKVWELDAEGNVTGCSLVGFALVDDDHFDAHQRGQGPVQVGDIIHVEGSIQ